MPLTRPHAEDARLLVAATLALCAVVVAVAPATASPATQAPAPAVRTPAPEYVREVASLATRSEVFKAFRIAEELNEWARQVLVELTEIPAPPFMEDARGRRYAELLAQYGADSVWTDAEGNVIGLRRGRGGSAEGVRTVGFGGHLDTVFPEGTDVTVRQRGDTLFAPGVADDTRGLVVVLAVLRAMEEAGLETRDDVIFTGVVGEEGLGDLRGMKHLFREPASAPAVWIDIDGGGVTSLVTMGLGSVRYRVSFAGPGGHSWGAFGLANPAHALGRAISYFQDVADTLTRAGPRTSYNVGRLGGGTSVNAVPFEAWAEVDMRSVSPRSLERIEAAFLAAMDRALEEENALRRDGPPLSVEKAKIGDRPSGEGDPAAPLIQRALAATAFVGAQGVLRRSSTNSNVPIALGMPAVTMGGGGEGYGAHSLDEYWIDRDSHLGVQRALLVVTAEAGLAQPIP